MSSRGCNNISPNSLLGSSNNFIKYNGSDLVATDGPLTAERLILSDLRIPYAQILKSRIILKAGQQNYLLNNLGLGDSSTFLTIIARYDDKSVMEKDNYVEYYYYTDQYRKYYFSSILTLTGNSTHRTPQIYLNNPNINKQVTLDVMVAVIDDSASFFSGVTTPLTNAISFTNLTYDMLRVYNAGTYPVNTVSVHDSSGDIIAFLELSTINSLTLASNVIIVDDASLGVIYFQFVSVYDAEQAYSWLNYLLENPNGPITGTQSGTGSTAEITPIPDIIAPYILFYPNVILPGGPSLTYSSTWSSPTQSFISTTTMSLTAFGGIISKYDIENFLVNYVVDNRDGTMSLTNSNIVLIDNTNYIVNNATHSGTYSALFYVSDLAGNSIGTNFIVQLPIA